MGTKSVTNAVPQYTTQHAGNLAHIIIRLNVRHYSRQRDV